MLTSAYREALSKEDKTFLKSHIAVMKQFITVMEDLCGKDDVGDCVGSTLIYHRGGVSAILTQRGFILKAHLASRLSKIPLFKKKAE